VYKVLRGGKLLYTLKHVQKNGSVEVYHRSRRRREIHGNILQKFKEEAIKSVVTGVERVLPC
jgi:hypothetical protein